MCNVKSVKQASETINAVNHAAGEQPAKAKKSTRKPASKPEKDKATSAPSRYSEKLSITVVAYSERSFAVFGDTKPIRDRLKAVGGRFNALLYPKGATTPKPGWIFSNKARADVDKLLSTL